MVPFLYPEERSFERGKTQLFPQKLVSPTHAVADSNLTHKLCFLDTNRIAQVPVKFVFSQSQLPHSAIQTQHNKN